MDWCGFFAFVWVYFKITISSLFWLLVRIINLLFIRLVQILLDFLLLTLEHLLKQILGSFISTLNATDYVVWILLLWLLFPWLTLQLIVNVHGLATIVSLSVIGFVRLILVWLGWLVLRVSWSLLLVVRWVDQELWLIVSYGLNCILHICRKRHYIFIWCLMMSYNRILIRFIVTIATVLRVVAFVFDDLRIQLIICNIVVNL